MSAGQTVTSTSTILVTDVVGSTELRSRLGEDAAEAVRREHDELLARAVSDHAGIVVKGLGDGILARFAGAADAVSAAVAIQQAAVVHARSHLDTELSIRIGISAGDVSLEGNDCFGTPVIEASRLCAEAQGGQILVAELVRLLARGRGGHGFRPLGERQLRGLNEAVLVDEVAWVPLAEESASDVEGTEPPFTAPLPSALAAADRFPYAGRALQREAAWNAWKQSAGGDRQVVLISGEPGMGKTRLAFEVARLAHDQGAVVLFGRADEDVDTPYRPIAEALRHLVAHAPLDILEAHVAAVGGTAARVVPELLRRVPELRAPAVEDTDRSVLFDAVVDLIGRASARSPLVLVLDDLHWADHPSLLLLRHLTRADAAMAVTVLGTYRDTDLVRTHPLALVLADLRRERNVARIPLEGLDQDEIGQLMALTTGNDLDERALALAAAIAGETAGNPFFVGEVLVHLAESGAIYRRSDGTWTSDASDVSELGVPEGVREVIGRRLSTLSPEANEVLRTASVLGIEFDIAVVAAVLDEPVDAVIDFLDDPLRRGLVAEASGVDHYRFPHALVRQTLYEELSMSRRVRLHARLVDALEATHRGTVEERAHHAVLSAPVAAPERAVELASAAATAAAERLAFEQAVGWYRRALEAEEVVEPPDALRRGRLLVELARARNESGEAGPARADVLEAAALARRGGDQSLLAAAAMTYGGTMGQWLAYDDTAGLELIEEALESTTDEVTRAQLLLARSSWLKLSGSEDLRRAAVDEATVLARRLGSDRLLAAALFEAAEVDRDSPDVDAFLARAAELDSILTRMPSPTIATSAEYERLFAAGRVGDVRRFAEAVRRMAVIGEESRVKLPMWVARSTAASLNLLLGRFDEAEAHAMAALEIGSVAGVTADLVATSQRSQIAFHRGEMDHWAAMYTDGADRFSQVFIPALVHARVAFDAEHDLDKAARFANEWMEAIDVLPMASTALAMVLGSYVAEVLAPEQAALAYERLLPWGSLWPFGGPELIFGSAAWALARYARRMGRLNTAIEHFAVAERSHAEGGEVPFLAGLRCEFSEALQCRDADGDAERAKTLAVEARSVAEAVGMPMVARRAAALV